jgi:hypothetical protein
MVYYFWKILKSSIISENKEKSVLFKKSPVGDLLGISFRVSGKKRIWIFRWADFYSGQYFTPVLAQIILGPKRALHAHLRFSPPFFCLSDGRSHAVPRRRTSPLTSSPLVPFADPLSASSEAPHRREAMLAAAAVAAFPPAVLSSPVSMTRHAILLTEPRVLPPIFFSFSYPLAGVDDVQEVILELSSRTDFSRVLPIGGADLSLFTSLLDFWYEEFSPVLFGQSVYRHITPIQSGNDNLVLVLVLIKSGNLFSAGKVH